MNVLIIISITNGWESFIGFLMDWFHVNLIKKNLIVLVFDAPLTYFLYLVFSKQVTSRIMRVDNNIPLFTCLIRLFNSFKESTLQHRTEGELYSWFWEISLEKEVERTIKSNFIVFLEHYASPVVDAWRRSVAPKEIVLFGTVTTIMFKHVQKWFLFRCLVPILVHKLFLSIRVRLWC